jgi:hypothetical protein
MFDDPPHRDWHRVRDPIVMRLKSQLRLLCDALVPKAVAVNATNLGRMSVAEGRTLRRLLGKLLEVPIPRGH